MTPLSAGAGPLAGVRVLDLTRNLAGPYCTQTLADLGAYVVKVEDPRGGDDTRGWSPVLDGTGAAFLAANRSKRSIAVDFDEPEGLALVRRLAESCDVLVEAFKPGSLDRKGLGFEDLSQANPGLVYCSVSAFGGVGPRGGEAGYDPVLQAATGIMAMTGDPEGRPARMSVAAIDLGTAAWATIGIMGALMERSRTGRGARIEASLYETATWWQSYHLAGFLGSGVLPGRYGSGTPVLAPYQLFPTADGEVFVAAGNDRLFATVCEIVGAPELAADPRFVTNSDRTAHQRELESELSARFSTRTTEEWVAALNARKVPCSPLRTMADLVADPQTEALGLLHPTDGPVPLVDMPVRRDGTRAVAWRRPPRLGEHTDEVLTELGVGSDELARLRAASVIA